MTVSRLDCRDKFEISRNIFVVCTNTLPGEIKGRLRFARQNLRFPFSLLFRSGINPISLKGAIAENRLSGVIGETDYFVRTL